MLSGFHARIHARFHGECTCWLVKITSQRVKTCVCVHACVYVCVFAFVLCICAVCVFRRARAHVFVRDLCAHADFTSRLVQFH